MDSYTKWASAQASPAGGLATFHLLVLGGGATVAAVQGRPGTTLLFLLLGWVVTWALSGVRIYLGYALEKHLWESWTAAAEQDPEAPRPPHAPRRAFWRSLWKVTAVGALYVAGAGMVSFLVWINPALAKFAVPIYVVVTLPSNLTWIRIAPILPRTMLGKEYLERLQSFSEYTLSQAQSRLDRAFVELLLMQVERTRIDQEGEEWKRGG